MKPTIKEYRQLEKEKKDIRDSPLMEKQIEYPARNFGNPRGRSLMLRARVSRYEEQLFLEATKAEGYKLTCDWVRDTLQKRANDILKKTEVSK